MWETVWEILEHALLDSLQTLPFLFLAYLLIEFLEHHASGKMEKALAGSGKLGVVIGALLGCVPQCGFSAIAANLYAGRIITLGTLMAVFLSTSDEMIIIMLSEPGHVGEMLLLIGIKVVIAVLAGLVIDFIVKRNNGSGEENIKKLCSGCGCEHGIFLSALKHTVSIFAIVLAANIVLGGLIHLVGEENLGKFMLSGSFFQPILAAVIGLIPNCAASVLITELYIGGALTLSSAVSGLCAGAGVGLIVLFRANRNLKDCVRIILLLFGISAAAGLLLSLFGL
ncbi:MAG TPA: arsenic efflux protein [Firmicutes bacterium]|nr:arsenic efflux protein [Bacillota bacterium]